MEKSMLKVRIDLPIANTCSTCPVNKRCCECVRRDNMLISNPDLINSCRVCRNPNQDGDYESLYEVEPVALMTPQLNEAGKLYERLFAKIYPETYDYYPRYLCNSCDLQMKLFNKLKDKALKTLTYLGKLYDEDLLGAREELKVIEDEEEFLASEDGAAAIGQEDEYIRPHTGFSIEEGLGDYIIPNSVHEVNNEPDITDIQNNIDLEENNTEENAELSVVEDLQNIPGIDKSDYVLEIYKVLEEGTHNAVSESGVETEVDGSNLKIDEVENLSQHSFMDEQYVDIDTFVTAEKSDHDTRSAKRRKYNKPTLQIGENIKIYRCTECNEIFTCAKDFKHHRTYIHAQKYVCKICSTVTKSARLLSTHMKIHSDTPAFQCDICQRTFTQKIHYQYHMNRHNNVRNFKCDQCEKSFLAKGDLKIHMRVHTGDRPYVCEICGKGYMMSEHLKAHAFKHTDQQFPCELCSLKFVSPKTLRQHVSSIHAPEPNFKCEYCMKPFRRKHHLQYHMKLHPENILADPNYSIIDDSKDVTSLDNADDNLEVYSQADIAADGQLDEGQDDIIRDPGFVALPD